MLCKNNLTCMKYYYFICFYQRENQDLQSISNTTSVSQFLVPKETQKKKKSCRSQESIDRWNRIRRVNAFPRVLKRDVRRNYPFICVNAINSGDIEFYSRMFVRYFHPECLWNISKDQFGPSNIPIRGPEEHLKLYCVSLEYMPDFNVSLINYRIRVDPNTNESKIFLKLKYSGTLSKCHPKDCNIFQDQAIPHDQILSYLSTQKISKDDYTSIVFNKMSELSLLNDFSNIKNDEFIAVPQPIKAGFEADIIFHLNQNYYVTRIDELLLHFSFNIQFMNI